MNYCSLCGSLLEETSRLSHYDSSRGTPLYLFTRQCPRRRWWNGQHTKASVVAADPEEAARVPDFHWNPYG